MKGKCRAFLLVAALCAVAETGAADGPVRLSKGAELFEAGDFSGAAEFFAGVDPGADAAWIDYYRGRILLEEGDLEEAIATLLRATEARPEISLFHRWLGEAYVQKIDQVGMLKKLGVAKKARASFQEAVRLAPEDLEAREALAGYYLNAPGIAGGDRAKAEQQAEALMSLSPAKGHALRGRIYLNEREWKSSEAQYQAAIQMEPENPEYHYWLGFVRQQGKDFPAAFEAFEQALVIDSEYMAAYYQIGRTAVFSETNLGRAAQSLEYYLEQRRRPGTPLPQHAHWRLGMVYELQGKRNLAADEYRAALELDPKHEEARKALRALGES